MSAKAATARLGGTPTPAEAELAIATLLDISVDVRGCALLDGSELCSRRAETTSAGARRP
jgi:hypothetical protein